MNLSLKYLAQKWWDNLRYEPNDPRLNAGGLIKIAAIGGGTGLPNLLRGLKKYSGQISAIVTVTDAGGSTGELRKDFDMVAPGDIRKCISALVYDEDLFSALLEHRFSKSKRTLGGHTLGNIWITALTDYYKSFEKAVEVTSSIFHTAGTVYPATLDNVNVCIEYEDGKTYTGEHYLDEILNKIDKVYLNKKRVKAYKKAVAAISEADLILIGPGSLYASLITNFLVKGIRESITNNRKAVKIYISNCSTERTQTRSFSVEDHIVELQKYGGKRLFDYCLVNNRIIKRSKDETVLGEVNNITTNKKAIEGVEIFKADVINRKNPLFHDRDKLAKAVIDLYNKVRKSQELKAKSVMLKGHDL